MRSSNLAAIALLLGALYAAFAAEYREQATGPAGGSAAAAKSAQTPAFVSTDSSTGETHAAATDALAAFYRLYALAPGENFKLLLAPFVPGRSDFYRQGRTFAEGAVVREPRAYYFKWAGGELTPASLAYGDNALWRLIATPLGLGALDFDGDARLLTRPILGDVIWREGTPQEELAAQMEQAFAGQFVTPVTLQFRDEPREVYVVSGDFAFRPRPGVFNPYGDVVQIDPSPPREGDPSVIEMAFNVGILADFLARVRGCIGYPIVFEAGDQARTSVSWLNAPRLLDLTEGGMKPLPDYELSAVLAHLSKQTGLTFTKEERNIRRLFVALADSDQKD